MRGDISTGLVAAGLVTSAIGVYLWRSSSSSATLSGSLAPTGVMFTARF